MQLLRHECVIVCCRRGGVSSTVLHLARHTHLFLPLAEAFLGSDDLILLLRQLTFSAVFCLSVDPKDRAAQVLRSTSLLGRALAQESLDRRLVFVTADEIVVHATALSTRCFISAVEVVFRSNGPQDFFNRPVLPVLLVIIASNYLFNFIILCRSVVASSSLAPRVLLLGVHVEK